MNLAVPLLLIIVALQVEPIQVFSDETGAVVTRDYTIWVDHRHYLEHQAVSQMASTLRYQVVYDAMKDPG